MSEAAHVGAGRALRLRGFIEGVEFPIISAQISMQPNAPAQCVLQVPPGRLDIHVLARALVHLFYLDTAEGSSSLLSYRGNDPSNPSAKTPGIGSTIESRSLDEFVSSTELERELRNRQYKTIFCGEVIGFQEVQTPMSYSMVLQCLDLSNYWDYAYQFNNSDLFGPGIKALLAGGATNLFTDYLSSPSEIVTGLLKLPSANYPAMKGLLGGLVRMIESIGGCFQQDTKFMGQNVFFSIAELRLRISQMLTAYPEDQTIPRLLGGSSPDGIFGRTLGNLGEQVSIRAVFNAIASILFHETYACPAALYVNGSSTNVKGQSNNALENLPEYQYITVLTRQVYLFSREVRGDLGHTPVGKTPRETNTSKDQMLRRFSAMLKQLTGVTNKAAQDSKLRTPRNRKVRELLAKVRQHLTNAQVKVRQRWAPGIPEGPITKPIAAELEKAENVCLEIEQLVLDTSDAKKRLPARLQNQIVKPDTWFAAPPRCNVVLPHQITQRSYARTFMQEPTRLLLKTHNEFFGEDELFDSYFFAPRARSMTGKRRKGTLAELFQRDIMTHELYTGIIPIFTKMGEFNILALRGQREALKKEKDRPKISLAQRSANFLYFKHRFASRSMTLGMVFSPLLAPGFPGLYISKYVSADDLANFQARPVGTRKSLDMQASLGKHYLGVFTNIQHSLSFMQAETQVQVQYPREYAESAEFLGPSVADDQVVIKRFGTDARRVHTVAALERPKLGGLGIFYGVIEKVEEISDAVEGMYFPIYTGPRRVGDPAQSGQSVIGTPVRLGDVSPALAALKGVNQIVTFRAFQVTEAIPRYRREKVDLPAEEAIRPGWYDDVWHPAVVGKVYQTYFETGSITDAMQIGDPGGVSVGTAKQLARDQLAREATGKTQGDEREGISPAILTLDQDSSVEQAVDFLLTTYSYIMQAGMNPTRFAEAYTWRPTATLADLLGTSDLEFDAQGIKAVRGIEGFHSRAFGPYNDLFGLVTPEVTEVLGATKTSQARNEGDVRGRRHRMALDFVTSLRQTHLQGKLEP